MKKILVIISALVLAASCAEKAPSVMARYVPERADDFVWENDLVCYRVYGKALEGNPTSPGFDIWVKYPGKLIADTLYKNELVYKKSYHKNLGDGKDCYKVAVSLGGGASAPYVNGCLEYPATNYRSWEILEQKPSKTVFCIHYPQWEMSNGVKVALDKKFTVTAGTYFCKCEDTYTFEGCDELEIFAGVNRHTDLHGIENESIMTDSYALWEHASDQVAEPEDGFLGVAVIVPGTGLSMLSDDLTHGGCVKKVKSGEPFSYYFGTCWSKAGVESWNDWLSIVRKGAK